jgi:GH18 family chitinase
MTPVQLRGRAERSVRFLCACAASWMVACGGGGGGTGSSTTPTPTPATLIGALPARADFKVVGYSPSWTDGVLETQWARLTHVNYAFLNPNEGRTVAQVPNPSLLDGLVAAAHAKGKTIFLSVGGWTEQNNGAFELAGADAAAAALFAQDMMAIVDRFDLDGIDIDWEWPSPQDGSDQKYARVMEAVCAALHSVGKGCSTAVVASGASGIPGATFAYVDWFNVMVYDLGAGASHTPYSAAVGAFDYWAGRGLPSAKTILGIPFYGRGATFSVEKTYKDLVADDPAAPNNDSSNGIFYNGIPTVQKKVDLALQRGGGIMIWELSQDTNDGTSLLAAIRAQIG